MARDLGEGRCGAIVTSGTTLVSWEPAIKLPYSPNVVVMEFCELRPNAARERKMVQSVQGVPVSVPYRKSHPGNPNTSGLQTISKGIGDAGADTTARCRPP